MMHEALRIELPVFVSVGAITLPGGVLPLISKSHGNPRAIERPHFFDEAVVQLTGPFARQKLNDLFPAVDKFGAVAPAALDRIRQRHALRIARIPAVFRFAYFFDRRLTREGWH